MQMSKTMRCLAALVGGVGMAAGLLLGAPTANATDHEVVRATTADIPHSKLVTLPPAGADAVTTALGERRSVVSPRVNPWVYVDSAEGNSCVNFRVCFWTGDYYQGTIYIFGGDYPPCYGWRFEGKSLQDHAYSFWNRGSGTVSVLNRYADGSPRYVKIGTFGSGFNDSYRFSYSTDAWIYDPAGVCAEVALFKVP